MRQPEPQHTHSLLYAAITVVVGVFLSLLARYTSQEYQLSVIMSSFTKQMTDIQREATKGAEKARQDMEAARQAAAANSAQDRMGRAQAQRDKYAAQQAAIDAASQGADAKESAWNRYYQPSAHCLSYESRSSVECANEHVRAKREFEAKWAAGQL